MTPITTLPAAAPRVAFAEALSQDGALIVEEFLSADAVQRLNAELAPIIDKANPAMRHLNDKVGAFFGAHVKHVSGLPGKSRAFAEEVMCHALMLDLCDRVLLPNCASYRLNLAHLMERGPGAERQSLHRDHDVWKHFGRFKPQDLELQVSAVVALCDFTKQNGATALVPGSHRWPLDRAAREDEIVYAEMPAGAAVIYLGSMIHAGGANTTRDQWRRGFHMSYTLGWLRTEENNALAVAPDFARTLSRRAQQLVGYGVHDAVDIYGGYLGMVDMRDPGELLAEGAL